jgi:ribose 5-phosphate isomerase A
LPVFRELQRFGGKLGLRMREGEAGPVVTDHGNFIFDLLFSSPVDPPRLESELKLIPGVVEVGFFSRKRPTLIVGRSDGRVEEAEA